MFWIRDVDGTQSAEGLTAERLSRLQMESCDQRSFKLFLQNRFTLCSLTSGCRQKFRQEHHIRVKSIQVTRFSASPLKLSPFSLKKKTQKHKENTANKVTDDI